MTKENDAEENFIDMVEEVTKLITDGKLEEAIELWQKGDGTPPTHDEFRTVFALKAQRYFDGALFAEALDCLSEARSLPVFQDPADQIYFRLQRVFLLRDLSRVPEATAELKAVLDIQPNHPEAVAQYATAMFHTSRDPAATLDALNAALNSDSKDGWMHCARALVLFKMGRLADVNSEFEAVQHMQDDSAAFYVLRADLANAIGDREFALQDLTTAIEKRPTSPDLFLIRALLYLSIGYLRNALEDCDRSLALKMDNSRALKVRQAILNKSASGK